MSPHCLVKYHFHSQWSTPRVLTSSCKCSHDDDESSMTLMRQIDRYLLTQRQRSNNCCSRQLVTLSRYCCLVGGKRHGNYLTVSYLVVKLAYLANAVCQLFLLEFWLGFDYSGYGVRTVLRALRGYEWHFGDSFPRVTLCAFQVSQHFATKDGILHVVLHQCQ